MKKTNICVLAFLLISAAVSGSSHTMEDARKIDRFLTRIAGEPHKRVVLRKVTFTQEELNAYLNRIYIPRFAKEVSRLELQLQNENVVSGAMDVRLEGDRFKGLPSFLRDFNLRFEGHLESKNRRMRYLFKDIRINGTRFAPEVLDEAFASAQTGFRVQKSIFDWFTLLPGLKKVAVESGRITLYY